MDHQAYNRRQRELSNGSPKGVNAYAESTASHSNCIIIRIGLEIRSGRDVFMVVDRVLDPFEVLRIVQQVTIEDLQSSSTVGPERTDSQSELRDDSRDAKMG